MSMKHANCFNRDVILRKSYAFRHPIEISMKCFMETSIQYWLSKHRFEKIIKISVKHLIKTSLKHLIKALIKDLKK